MKPLGILLALIALLTTLSSAAATPNLAELTRRIETFPTTRGQGTDSERLTRFFELYWDARMRQTPDFAAYIGYAGVDDLLPDLSHEGFVAMQRLTHLELAALDSIDRARLSAAEQLSYDLLRRRLGVEVEGERFHSFDPWHNEYLLVEKMNNRIVTGLGLLEYNPGKTVADYEAMLTRLRGFPRMVDDGIAQLQAGLERGITPPRVTLRKVTDETLTEIQADPAKNLYLERFQHIPETIPAAERERIQKTAAEIWTKQDVPALLKLYKYLNDRYIPNARETIAITDLPDGKAWYAYLLRYATTTNLTPEEIHQLGLDEVKRIRAEIDALIKSTGFQGDFKAFSEFVRTDPRFFWEKPEDMITGYRDIAKRLDPELIKLFGRLPRLPYGVADMEDQRGTSPSALYSNGTLAGGRPGLMLINTFDLKSRPKWGMESLTLHEAVPGHHLQYSLVEELGELPAWRRWDIYTAFSEGWGLYAEGLGSELGLYKDPYSKFGQLNNEVWRAIRLVVDTGLHAKGWTRQQTIDYCRANSAKTDLEITNEVDRYIAHPGGATAYKIGAMKLQELRRYAEKELGDKFDIRAFHDHVLGSGQLPLDLLETSVKAWVAGVRTGEKR
jgi:uncharacterized protein (DUF885 family)